MTGSSFEEGELEAAIDGSGAGRVPGVPDGFEELLATARTPTERRLYRSMLDTVANLARAGTDVIDLKVADTALAEMAEAFRVFQPLRRRKKVTIFGSARTEPDHPAYRQARALAATMAGAGWMVVTGAGPGIMAAGMEGAGREQSIGVNIRLPHEQGANRFIAQDPKLVEMRYFFTRKLMLLKESDGFIVLPGGFGTLDEGFELLTLLQTGKAEPAPVVLLDVPGGTYWDGWSRFLAEEVEPRGLVAPDDRAFFTITDDVATASAELLAFYRNYRSCRWVGRPARPPHGHPPGPGPAGRPQPPVRRHRGVGRHPQGGSATAGTGRRRRGRPAPAGPPVRQGPLRTPASAHRRRQRTRRRLSTGRRRWPWRPSGRTSGADDGAAGRVSHVSANDDSGGGSWDSTPWSRTSAVGLPWENQRASWVP